MYSIGFRMRIEHKYWPKPQTARVYLCCLILYILQSSPSATSLIVQYSIIKSPLLPQCSSKARSFSASQLLRSLTHSRNLGQQQVVLVVFRLASAPIPRHTTLLL
jgi:hypothetical protein